MTLQAGKPKPVGMFQVAALPVVVHDDDAPCPRCTAAAAAATTGLTLPRLARACNCTHATTLRERVHRVADTAISVLTSMDPLAPVSFLSRNFLADAEVAAAITTAEGTARHEEQQVMVHIDLIFFIIIIHAFVLQHDA
jgi:hypothetical protein